VSNEAHRFGSAASLVIESLRDRKAGKLVLCSRDSGWKAQKLEQGGGSGDGEAKLSR